MRESCPAHGAFGTAAEEGRGSDYACLAGFTAFNLSRIELLMNLK